MRLMRLKQTLETATSSSSTGTSSSANKKPPLGKSSTTNSGTQERKNETVSKTKGKGKSKSYSSDDDDDEEEENIGGAKKRKWMHEDGEEGDDVPLAKKMRVRKTQDVSCKEEEGSEDDDVGIKREDFGGGEVQGGGAKAEGLGGQEEHELEYEQQEQEEQEVICVKSEVRCDSPVLVEDGLGCVGGVDAGLDGTGLNGVKIEGDDGMADSVVVAELMGVKLKGQIF